MPVRVPFRCHRLAGMMTTYQTYVTKLCLVVLVVSHRFPRRLRYRILHGLTALSFLLSAPHLLLSGRRSQVSWTIMAQITMV
ncbi:hypothetical protein BO78DRAFT_10074 [Aspergillus sclerotiicarbonarius CBS 121057]|uniref:Uncharacterized protein n=1 Tax=Aspergillus sclerotiicarbonarius (strain CBS 121057 / IBT 28362) TaxID=1448318 RepID=A0A319EHX1_ASPSB|nr:hypothetical protein BO78DRAFT_10074 [Aspergillus sclerotiicarbonarius CBS 121057]